MKKLRWMMMVLFISVALQTQGAKAQDTSSTIEERIFLTSTDINGIEQDHDQILLSDLLTTLEEHFDVTFLYKDEAMANKYVQRDKIQIEDRAGRELSHIFDQLGFIFQQIDEQTYVLLNKDLSLQVSRAQEAVSGTVTDGQSGETLPGVNVMVKGTTTGTSTDANGGFELTVESLQDTLIFSFVGYQTREMPINGRTELDVALQPQAIAGEELVVVGYGTVEKRDLTGSVTSVSSDEVTAVPSANVMQALQGRAAGVQVQQNNGHPGGEISIRIRGANSIVGNNEPLYIVDGFPVDDPESINNSSIESIEVLKDASAVAIYGSRASNGVVLITTNSGMSGATEVNFESSIGYQSLIKSIEMMHPLEFGEYYNVLENNMVGEDRFSQEQLNEFEAMGEGTIWEDVVYQRAPILNNSLNIRGGNEKTQFSITGSSFNQEGIIRNSDYNRYAVDSKIQHAVSEKFSVNASLTLSRIETRLQNSEQGRFGTSLIGRAHGIPNYIPAYNDNGNRVEPVLVDERVSEALWHPDNFIEERKRTRSRNNVLANAELSYKFIEELALNVKGGIESKNTRNDFYQTKDFQNNPNGAASVSTEEYMSRLLEATLNYTGTITKNHDISAVIGATFQDFKTKSLGGSGSNFLSDIPGSHSLATAGISGIPNTSFTESTILSGLGRINYTHADRYLFTVSMRADGSSVYTEGNKWGYFPSVAFSWRLSDEEFINLDNTIINELKLRTSWGLSGSQAISPYSTLNRLNPGNTVLGNSLVTTMAPGSRLASDLKWETTEALNFGLDVSLLENRVTFIADYYIKETSDLLNAVQLPRSTGYTNSLRNVGRISNRGFEFAINSHLVSSNEFNWNLDANISFNRSKVEELYGGQDILGGQLSMIMFTDWANIYREGEPRGIIYGYKEDGYDENGYIQYTTAVGDKVKIGNPNPNFIFGINSDMSYRNFTLSMFISGTQGNDIINMSKVAYTTDHTNGTNKLRDIVGKYWTPENTNAKYIKPSRNHDFRFSDRYVEDGSYIRLNNIELAYSVPNQLLPRMRHAQVYISGQNLLTLTSYSWIDPDVNTRGGPSSLAQGIDYESYPSAKSITVGVRLGF